MARSDHHLSRRVREPRRFIPPSTAVTCVMLMAAACTAGWHQPPELALGPMDEGQQVRVWHGGGVERWHSVVVTADSVLGVHWRQPRGCDSCRVALPVAAVDSVQIGNPMRVFWRGLGIAGVVILVATAPWWLPT